MLYLQTRELLTTEKTNKRRAELWERYGFHSNLRVLIDLGKRNSDCRSTATLFDSNSTAAAKCCLRPATASAASGSRLELFRGTSSLLLCNFCQVYIRSLLLTLMETQLAFKRDIVIVAKVRYQAKYLHIYLAGQMRLFRDVSFIKR